jgi:hypothetical protein
MLLTPKSRQGFGLIETLIASGIVVMVAASSVGLSSMIIRRTTAFDEQIVGQHLAAEAVEIAHWVRGSMLSDSNPSTIWSSGFLNAGPGGTGTPLNCPIPANPISPSAPVCGVSPKRSGSAANTNTFDNFGFTQPGTPDVITLNNRQFTRRIYFDKPDPADSNVMAMRVVVSNDEDKIVSDIETQLTNWKEVK